MRIVPRGYIVPNNALYWKKEIYQCLNFEMLGCTWWDSLVWWGMGIGDWDPDPDPEVEIDMSLLATLLWRCLYLYFF